MNPTDPAAVIRNYSPPADLLDGKIILLTGANRGIGRALAIGAAACGAKVILSGRDVKGLEKVDDEIRSAGHTEASLMPLDLQRATVDDYQDAAQAVRDSFGRLDGLVHVAGLLGEMSTIEHYPPMTWHNVMHVNVSAPFLMTRALLPLMVENDDSSIVFTSSSVGRKGRAHWGAYSVSKFATEGLMQTLADELNSRPRVNSLNPGATRTAMRRAAYPGEDPATLTAPEEIVPAFLYLLGNDSRDVNGCALDAQG